MDGELHVRATRGHPHAFEDGERVVAQVLELLVGERLRGRDGDRVSRVDAHGVDVLDGADDDAVALGVTHHLHLDLLPALDGLLDEHLVLGRELEALTHDAPELRRVAGDAATGTTECERGADDDGEANLTHDPLGILEGMGDVRTRDLETDVGHCLGEELTVLPRANGLQVAPDDLDAKALEHARLAERDGAVERRLATHVGKERVRPLALDHACDGVHGDGLNVGAVGRLRVGHDRRGVGVHEDDLVALAPERSAGLGARVVELARLADHDGARAYDQDLLDVCAPRHYQRLPSRTSMAR